MLTLNKFSKLTKQKKEKDFELWGQDELCLKQDWFIPVSWTVQGGFVFDNLDYNFLNVKMYNSLK